MTQRSSILICAALLGVSALSAQAQKQGGDTGMMIAETAPGKGMIVSTRKIVATVQEVDAAKGYVTLKGPQGNLLALAVGPEVRNLAQVKVGDKVVVRYVEALSLTLKKDGKELRSSTQVDDAARTASGALPGAAAGKQVTVVADVTGVNAKTHLVRLRGPERTVDLYVADPKQLKLIKVGDQVEAVYTEALAVSVEPVAAVKK